MSSSRILEDLTRDVLFLKQEVDRLSKLTSLYEVLNHRLNENLTANHNNYALEDYDFILFTPTANRTIHGLTNGVSGRFLIIRNASDTFTITFTHLNAAATTGNKIATGTGGSIILGTRKTAIFTYSTDSIFGQSLWLLLIPGV